MGMSKATVLGKIKETANFRTDRSEGTRSREASLMGRAARLIPSLLCCVYGSSPSVWEVLRTQQTCC